MIALILGHIEVCILCRADGYMFRQAILANDYTAGVHAGLPDASLEHPGIFQCLCHQRIL